MVPHICAPCAILFYFEGGFMEEYDMVQVWKLKIRELELQLELMKKDPQFSEEEINDMKEMIKQAKSEYTKELLLKEKEEKNAKRNQSR